MKHIKRILAVILAGLMFVSAAPLSKIQAYAIYESNINSYCYPIRQIANTGRGFTSGHKGVDFTIAKGTPIYSSCKGTVVDAYDGCKNYSGASEKNGIDCKAKGCTYNLSYMSGNGYKAGEYCNNGLGNGVVIKEDGSERYFHYGHMSAISVKKGASVTPNTKIGEVGSSGCSTGAHLHFSISNKPKSGTFYNPYKYVFPVFKIVLENNGSSSVNPKVNLIFPQKDFPAQSCTISFGTSTSSYKTSSDKDIKTPSCYYNLGTKFGNLTKGTTYYFKITIKKDDVTYQSSNYSFVAGSGNKTFLDYSTVTQKKVTLTFDANGGTIYSNDGKQQSSPYKYTFDEGILWGNLPTCLKTGSVFKGWYTKKEGGTLVRYNETQSESRTLYAHWDDPTYNNNPKAFTKGKDYVIFSYASDMCLTASGTENNSSVVQKKYTGAAAQKWTCSYSKDGVYSFASKANANMALDIAKNGNQYQSGNTLQVYTKNQNNTNLNQQFNSIYRTTEKGKDLYSIHCVCSGRALEIKSPNTQENQTIIQVPYHSVDQYGDSMEGPGQLFYFEDPSKITPESDKTVSGADIVAYARQQLGKPYGKSYGPDSFDCCGLVKYVFKHFNIDLPWNTTDYKQYGKVISVSEAKPGDLVVWQGKHVGIVSGTDMKIHAADAEKGVIENKISATTYPDPFYLRVYGVNGLPAQSPSETITATWSNYTVPTLTENDARVEGKVSFSKTMTFTECGFYLAKGNANLVKVSKHDTVTKDKTSEYRNLGYTMTDYYGKLESGTTYRYQFYVIADGKEYKSDVKSFTTKAAHSHTWNAGEVTTKATCTAAGVKTFTCTACKATKTESVPALGHNYGAWAKLDETRHQRVCANDASHKETEAHTWDNGETTTEPTCTADGVKTFTCTVCNAKKTEAVDATGHKYGDWTKLDDTQHQRVCANNASHKETEAHTWDEGVIKTQATAEQEGRKIYTCTVCGAEKTEVIPIQIDPSKPTVTISSITAKAGSTVDVYLSIENPVDIKSMSVSKISFDQTKLSLQSGEWLVSNTTLNNWNLNKQTGAIAFDQNTPLSGNIFKMTFLVAEDAENCTVELNCSVTAKETTSSGEKALTINVIPGIITVQNSIRGDVNGDGEVNSDDAIHVLYYTLLPDEYSVNQNCDFNNDGEENSDDAIFLLYYTLLPDDYPLN